MDNKPSINEEQIIDSSSLSHYIYSTDQVPDANKFEIFSLVDLLEQSGNGIQWIVDNLIPKNGITCIAGKPKSGKSYLLLDIAKCVAQGLPLFGEFETEQTGVLLIAKEDNRPLLYNRVKSLEIDKKLSIHFSTAQEVYFDNERFLPFIQQICAQNNIGLVLFDSFRRFTHGDENSSQSVSELHHSFRQLTNNNITVLFVHHHGKESGFNRGGAEKLRGSSDIWAMSDSVLTIERKEEKNVLKISQDALRQAKPVDSFEVQIPTFKDNDNEFTFVGESTPDTAIDQAKLDILQFLTELKTEAYQKDIIQALLGKNPIYADTTIKKAVTSLVVEGKVSARPEGNKKYYQLVKTEPSFTERIANILAPKEDI